MNPVEQIIMTTITAVLASGGLWSFVQWKLERKALKEDKDSDVKKALKALLHDRIYAGCEDAIRDGEISTEHYENLRYIYDPYTALGGNGTAKKLMEEVKDLPIKIKED